jgi:hypothetical protein
MSRTRRRIGCAGDAHRFCRGTTCAACPVGHCQYPADSNSEDHNPGGRRLSGALCGGKGWLRSQQKNLRNTTQDTVPSTNHNPSQESATGEGRKASGEPARASVRLIKSDLYALQGCVVSGIQAKVHPSEEQPGPSRKGDRKEGCGDK